MDNNRVVDLLQVKRILAGHRIKGHRIGFTNGCFDIVHAGHIKLLKEAKSKVDVLVLGLNSDASIARIKGPNRPIQDQYTRAAVMASMLSVDLVVLFEQDTPLQLIQHLQPDVLIKGGDWSEEAIIGADIVRSQGGEVVIIPIEKGYSTTSSIDKILRQCTSEK